MDRAKALDRIAKCLALSKSANEHEAAAALRQAQKLMAIHGISDDDVGLANYVSDFVDHDDYEFGMKKPMIVTCVADVMVHAFGVSFTWECSPLGKHRVMYFGLRQNVDLATFAHTVCYRALNAAWRRYLKATPWAKGVRNARAGFAYGWCQTVKSKIEDLAPKGETEELIKKAKERHYGKELPEAQLGTKSVYREMVEGGAEAGEDFNIHTPINTDRRYLDNKS